MNLDIKFMSYRRFATISSLVLLIFSIGSLSFKGLNLGLDFSGGTLIEVSYDDATDLSEKVRIYAIRKGFFFQENFWKLVDAFEKPNFPITGKELIKAGWSPGPDMGIKLKELERQWVMNEFKLPINGNIFSKNVDY